MELGEENFKQDGAHTQTWGGLQAKKTPIPGMTCKKVAKEVKAKRTEERKEEKKTARKREHMWDEYYIEWTMKNGVSGARQTSLA